MSDLKRRLQRLETLSTTGDAPTIAMIFSDGATVDGENLTIAEYENRVAGGDEPSLIVRVGGIGMNDI